MVDKFGVMAITVRKMGAFRLVRLSELSVEMLLLLCTCVYVCLLTTLTNGHNLGGRPGQGYVIQVLVGSANQSLNVLVDTGSANFAIAGAPHPNIDKYFLRNQSRTYRDLDIDVSLVYTQGKWSGKLAQDVVNFPTLNSVPQVVCDIVFITESQDFYVNVSDWQGILGLAYPAIAKPSYNSRSWIDYLQHKTNKKTTAFSLTLCGQKNINENKHYGQFEILNNVIHPYPGLATAMVIREWFYEIVLTGLFVDGVPVLIDCRSLNMEQSIVDSGTTNIRLPKIVFMELVKSLIFATNDDTMIDEDYTQFPPRGPPKLIVNNNATDRISLTKEFWLEQQKVCWTTPQLWKEMPIINIEVASTADVFFRINLPPMSYIREVFDDNDTNYCYKFSIEPTDSSTILGVVALEGFQVIFNRTAKTVGFLKSDCGPNVSIEGPYTYIGDKNLLEKCRNIKMNRISLLCIAGYITAFALLSASCIVFYIIFTWMRSKYRKQHPREISVSMSHANLIDENSFKFN